MFVCSCLLFNILLHFCWTLFSNNNNKNQQLFTFLSGSIPKCIFLNVQIDKNYILKNHVKKITNPNSKGLKPNNIHDLQQNKGSSIQIMILHLLKQSNYDKVKSNAIKVQNNHQNTQTLYNTLIAVILLKNMIVLRPADNSYIVFWKLNIPSVIWKYNINSNNQCQSGKLFSSKKGLLMQQKVLHSDFCIYRYVNIMKLWEKIDYLFFSHIIAVYLQQFLSLQKYSVYNLSHFSLIYNYCMRAHSYFLNRFLQEAAAVQIVHQQEQEQEGEDPFGQEAHKDMMLYLWTIVIDVAIFFALYNYRRYSIYIHAVIGLFVSLTTLITSLPILIQQGIPAEEDDEFQQRHFIIGLIVIIFIFVQVTVGIVSKVLQCIPWSSSLLIYLLNVFHKYAGYGFLILAKIQVFLILNLKDDQTKAFWGLLAAEIVFFILWLIRKLWFPTLQQTIVPTNLTSRSNQFRALKNSNSFADAGHPVATFANYVFSLEPLLRFHPIGYQIVNTIKGRDLDRYMYGMYTSERVPIVPTNSHTFKSLDLLGDPVGKLSISPLYSNIDKDVNSMVVESVRQISAKGSIYQVRLNSIENGQIGYNGYSSLEQLGRYFALTIKQKTTRLYTSVGFLDQKNIAFLIKAYIAPKNILLNLNEQRIVRVNQECNSNGSSSERRLTSSYLPILLKKYPTGTLTKQIIDEPLNKVQLSCSRGQGLHFAKLAPGKIIIVAGGTGLYPFSDLIDLLFKSVLIHTNPSLKAEIISHDSILGQNPFDKFSFVLYLAVNQIQDIHPITWLQINELVQNPDFFKVILKVRQDKTDWQLKSSKIIQNTASFDKLLAPQIAKNDFQKIWVCGPPPMNDAMISLFDQKKLDESRYLMV